jgi:CBS domain-containing protein
MAAEKSSNQRTIKDVMTSRVETISPTAGILEAAKKMKDLDVGAIPVCDGKRLQGMITDRDIVVRVLAEKRQAEATKVQDAMTPNVTYCYEDQSIDEAARVMEREQIRRLAIVDRDKQLVGIVSLGDVATKTDAPQTAAKTLEGVSSNK